jgi:hypothetical protein
LSLSSHAVLAPVSQGYSPPQDTFLRVPHPSATDRCRPVRLACVKHAASVRSEPGSNSQVHPAPSSSLRRLPAPSESPSQPQTPTLRPATLPTNHASLQTGHTGQPVRITRTTTSLADAQLERALGRRALFPSRGTQCRLSRYRQLGGAKKIADQVRVFKWPPCSSSVGAF